MQKENTIHKAFIAQINEAAKAAGTKPSVLCAMAGLHADTWKNWEAGVTSPTAVGMQKMINAAELYRRGKAMGR